MKEVLSANSEKTTVPKRTGVFPITLFLLSNSPKVMHPKLIMLADFCI